MNSRLLSTRTLHHGLVTRRLGVLLTGVVISAIAVGSARSADKPTTLPDRSAETAAKLPEFKEVETAVHKQLAKRRGYKQRDILSQSDVKAVFAAIEKLDWKVAEKKKILKAVLGDADFLVQQLRSRKGIPFMRKLSKSKNTYARLDQLRRLKYGKRRVRELIRNPGGHTLILYMTTTKGGKNLNRQLRRTKNGSNFGKPTKRVYTEKDLLTRLRESHAAELKRAKEPADDKKPEKQKPAK